MSNTTKVAVIIPCRNEHIYIEACLHSVLNNDYASERVEICVVDGMSTDGTREIIEQFIISHPERHIRLLYNTKGIAPSALNIGLDATRCDVIIRVDGHCELSSTYISQCVQSLDKLGADDVGGQQQAVSTTFVGRVIATATSSPFGVGGARFHYSNKAGWVDTVFLGAYRREVFDRIGRFDEELVRNQDDEFNFRLIQAGGRIWYDPSMVVRYYSRADIASFRRQYFQYGVYKVRVIQKRRGIASWRHLVPVTFVLALVVSLLLAVILGRLWLAGVVVVPYLVANLIASVYSSRHDWRTLPFLPVAFATMHIAYGLGFLMGLVRFRNLWARLRNHSYK